MKHGMFRATNRRNRVINWQRVLLLAGLLTATMVISAQDQATTFSPEQAREFNRLRLGVASDDSIFYSSDEVMVAGGIGFHRYMVGFNRVSEGEFFRIAGYYEEADHADRVWRRRRTGNRIMLGSLAVGTVAFFTNMMLSLNGIPNETEPLVGASFVVLGVSAAGLMSGPVLFGSPSGAPVYPAGQAIFAAEQYNRELRDYILGRP
jgi:hypothetical protein